MCPFLTRFIIVATTGMVFLPSIASAQQRPLPLTEAIINQDTNRLCQLLRENPSWRTTPIECGALLGYTVRTGSTNSLRALLAFGIHPHSADYAGTTPLAEAAERCEVSAIRMLVAAKAELNLTNKYGDTALVCAIKYTDCLQGAEELLKLGASPNAPNSNCLAPLHAAAARGSLPKIKLLLKYGADINATNHYGASAITFATRYSHYEVARHLLAAGADVKGKEMKDRTALSWSRWPQTGKSDPDLVRLLIEKGAVEGRRWDE